MELRTASLTHLSTSLAEDLVRKHPDMEEKVHKMVLAMVSSFL